MNTVRSVGYGWLVLIGAGGGAYFFAKRSINADRDRRHALEVERRAQQLRMENDAYARRYQQPSLGGGASGAAHGDDPNPSGEASVDPAPTRHAPENESQRVGEKSKYEASEVWRSKKGDRFS
ncbi:hypothetical protein EJ08DRAFT_701747 [Tothia fuscella]|uniref:Uncharacterized protein n=1 Tax=Tothia fuscella TaxID=1048955 RepID=A0A9P4NHN7_9PEZI|nr:hypothetical protein EJ08DRAFT_701747 [Tothia fuscella]